MAKKVHYYGGSSTMTVYLTVDGCKASKLGGLQIAEKAFADNPPPMFPLYPPNAAKLRLKTPQPAKNRKYRPLPQGAKATE